MERIDLKSVLTGDQPDGCVQPHLKGFAEELSLGAYDRLSIRNYVTSAAHLGRWMDSRRIEIKQLYEPVIVGFARHKCRCPLSRMNGRRPPSRYVKRVRRFVCERSGKCTLRRGLSWRICFLELGA